MPAENDEAAAVDAPERDPPLPHGQPAVARHAERAREHVCVPARDDPERLPGGSPFSTSLSSAVSAVDEDGVALCVPRQLDRVTLPLREQRLDRAEALLERAHARLADARREGVDDQRRAHEATCP